jgi:hypothetical protein
MGIEPTFRAWEARVLPLNYTRGGTTLGVVPVERYSPPGITRNAAGLRPGPGTRSRSAPNRYA